MRPPRFAHEAARDPRTYTPQHLAEKILTSRAALEDERKHVTVLFADVKGSMDLAEQVDPDVFHHVMERLAALLAEGVHRLEGTVTQFTGEGEDSHFPENPSEVRRGSVGLAWAPRQTFRRSPE